MSPTIELDWLEVQLGGRTILRSLTGVLDGRAIGLLGPNGAGKSTLINTILGFHTPSEGSVRVLGLDSRRDGKALRLSRPSTRTLPSEGVWKPRIVLMSVDFPAPFGPSRPMARPSRTPVRLRRIVLPPSWTSSQSSSIVGAMVNSYYGLRLREVPWSARPSRWNRVIRPGFRSRSVPLLATSIRSVPPYAQITLGPNRSR